jgi:hypothetical protein
MTVGENMPTATDPLINQTKPQPKTPMTKFETEVRSMTKDQLRLELQKLRDARRERLAGQKVKKIRGKGTKTTKVKVEGINLANLAEKLAGLPKEEAKKILLTIKRGLEAGDKEEKKKARVEVMEELSRDGDGEDGDSEDGNRDDNRDDK